MMAVRRCLLVATVLLASIVVLSSPAGASDDSRPQFDGNGDGADALVVTRRAVGTNNIQWFFADRPGVIEFGDEDENDRPVPGDYDGDGTTDAAVFRPDSPASHWIIRFSSGGFLDVPFGDQNDRTMQADYDGDGRTDIAVFRAGSPAATWHVMRSSGGFTTQPFGDTDLGDISVRDDFDCDGRADFVVRRPTAFDVTANARYIAMSSATGIVTDKLFGLVGDAFVPGDFDGDGCGDIASVRFDSGHWRWFLDLSSAGFSSVLWGDAPEDRRIAGDFNGDGRDDVAVTRESGDNHFELFARNSATGALIHPPVFGDTMSDDLLNADFTQIFT